MASRPKSDKLSLIHLKFWLLLILTVGVKSQENAPTISQSDSDLGQNDTEIYFDPGELEFDLKMGHELSIWENEEDIRSLRCQGKHIESLSILQCDSIKECEEKRDCLVDKTKCTIRDGYLVTRGRECSRSLSHYWYESLPTELASCYHVRLPSYAHGMVQCTSRAPGDDFGNVTTFDYFYYGHTVNESLLSRAGNLSSEQVKIRIYSETLHLDLNETAKGDKVTLWANEEILIVDCRVPKFIFKREGMSLHVHRKDGTMVKLSPDMTPSVGWGGLLRIYLASFRVPHDIVAFSCSAQMSHPTGQSDPWIQNKVQVAVKDPPSIVSVRAKEGKDITLNLTEGSVVQLHCELTGDPQVQSNITSQIRSMAYFAGHETHTTSIVEFLRIKQVVGDNYFCVELDDDVEVGKGGRNKRDLGMPPYLGHEVEYNFQLTVTLAPSSPKVYKPEGGGSQVQMMAQDENVVEQTLLCNFEGEPKPFVMWMKNSEELHYAMPSALSGNETMEQVRLQIGTMSPAHFHPFGFLNYSCVARNHLGVDRLDFIITRPPLPPSTPQQQQHPETTPTTQTEIKANISMPKTTSTPTTTTMKTTEKPKKETLTTASPPTTPGGPALLGESNNNNKGGKGGGLSNKQKGSYSAIVTSLVVVMTFLMGVSLFVVWRNKCASRRNAGGAAPACSRVPVPRHQPADPMYEVLLEDSHNQL